MESHVPGNRNESWTDEKHVHFLNSMEAWFVRTMLESNGRYNLRLDRQLPDSSDSTLDCKRNIQRRKKHATLVDFIGKTGSKMKKTSRPDRRSVRPLSQPHDSSQDQVVPQIKNRTGDKDEEDLPNVPIPVASLAPLN